MHSSISVLLLTLISTCCAHILDLGHRHENPSSGSSDFILAEKCEHCAHHEGSSSETTSRKLMVDSSKSQVLLNKDAIYQRNGPENGSTLISKGYNTNKNINASAVNPLTLENVQNNTQLDENTETITDSKTNNSPRSSTQNFGASYDDPVDQPVQKFMEGNSGTNSSELTSTQRNNPETSYNHGSQLEWSENWQSREHTNNSEVENAIDHEAPKNDGRSSIFSRWLSPKQISKSVKYALSNFLSESPVDKISKNLNSSRHGGNSSTFSSIYPMVLEGISVLANRLTDDDSADEDDLDNSTTSKGNIVNNLMNTINQALKFDNDSAIEESNSTKFRRGNGGKAFKGIEKLIESGFLKNTVSLVDQILKDNDFQNITSQLMNKSDTADVKNMFNKVSDVLQTTVFGLENALKHKDLLLAMTKPTNGTSVPINLSTVVSQYISKNGTSLGGDLSKNPLLQSAFVTKALSKSPVAHLGALDDDIKKLVTSSMEKAMSRIRIGEKGEIQMSDGMKKMLTKMVKEHEKSKNGSTDASSDSIMDMIQLVVKSGNIKEITLNDTGPIKRRNVTHHSPLHKKFQLKYGKSGGYTAILQSGLHHTLLVLLSLTVVPMI